MRVSYSNSGAKIRVCVTAIVEIRQQIALSQLSQTIDLPFLEGLVCAGGGSKDEPGYDNSVFFNVEAQHSLGMG